MRASTRCAARSSKARSTSPKTRSSTPRAYLLALAEEILEDQVDRFAGKALDVEEWDIPALIREVSRVFGLDPQTLEALELEDKSTDEIGDDDLGAGQGELRRRRRQLVGAELLRRVERDIMLQIVDAQWKDHLYSLDHLKEGIGLRGYGQRDPLVEYKKESFALFQDMKARIEEEMVRYLFWLRPVISEGADGEPPALPARPAPRRRHRPTDDEQSGGGAGAGVRRRRQVGVVRQPDGRRRHRRAPAATM